MHVPKGSRDAAIGHDDGYLMQGFRKKRPEIPIVLDAPQPGTWVPFDCMIEIRKAQRITKEEDRRVVANNVPIAVFSIELERKPSNIAFRIRRATFARHSRETGEHRSPFTYL